MIPNYLKEELGTEFIAQAEDYLQNPDRKKADQEYYQNIFPKVKELVRKRTEKAIASDELKKYEYLILSVGFSPQPLILTINALKPKKVFFLYSKDTQKDVDFIVEQCGLSFMQCKSEKIDASDIRDIYLKIRKILEENKLKPQKDKVVADITGGKKSMVAGVTLAATYFEMDLIYMDYLAYSSQNRKPFPGTEYIRYLPDPMHILGDKDFSNALVKFNAGHYGGAKEIFKKIAIRSDNPRKYEIYADLAEAYEAWDSFNFSQAYELLLKVQKNINQFGVLTQFLRRIEKSLNLLQPLSDFQKEKLEQVLLDKKKAWYLLANCYQTANRRSEQGRYDMACLLLYRTMEMFTQMLLLRKGIIPEKPDYEKLGQEKLLEKLNTIGEKLYKKGTYQELKYLPNKLALINGLLLLKVLEQDGLELRDLQRLQGKSEDRNKSIFAHGIKILRVNDFREFQNVINSFLEKAWEKDKKSLEEITNFYSFIEKFKFFFLENEGA